MCKGEIQVGTTGNVRKGVWCGCGLGFVCKGEIQVGTTGNVRKGVWCGCGLGFVCKGEIQVGTTGNVRKGVWCGCDFGYVYKRYKWATKVLDQMCMHRPNSKNSILSREDGIEHFLFLLH